MHLCWGDYEGPHHLDIELAKIIDVILRRQARDDPVRGGQPARHEHEHAVWREASLPADMILTPGVVDSTTNDIEHPELVAQRLLRFTEIVGPERVIAGTDCGFGTWSGFGAIDPDICWAELTSLAEGARIAAART